MLALSPPLFTANISYWPLEDPIGHDDQNYLYRNIEPSHSLFLNLSTPLPSDQRSRADIDCSATPSTTTAPISSGLSMAVKKLNHNACERDRRKKINHLYSSLRALLPASNHTKKLSIPTTVSRVLKYIPELQQQVEELVRKREELLSMTNSKQRGNLQVCPRIHNQTKNISRVSLSFVSASRLNDKEVAVQLSTYKIDKNLLSEILHNLEEDGLAVLNASSFESFGGRVFHSIHLQVDGSSSFECGTLSEKIKYMCDNKELLL
ncbi:hypothetical protein TIFTF001_039264 [Ficus carica]|uniref:BHLH domain-containing protein n=1 Tax=Ficus carica TaxID=3494 RepID=A0AA88JDR4_FICCA|nr:hypothetical protein TIFTF001_039264 [Ficus carica]